MCVQQPPSSAACLLLQPARHSKSGANPGCVHPDQGCWACLVGQGCWGRCSAGVCWSLSVSALHCHSCALLSRVLESLLVSLVTTVVVFVASMVLGECRQMSSTSQTGNGSFQLQVTLENLVSILQPEQCVRLEPCCSCLQLSVLCPSPERVSMLAYVPPALSKAQAVVHGKHRSLAYCSLSPGPFTLSLFRPAGHTDSGPHHLPSVM